jgi:hypothetical protein
MTELNYQSGPWTGFYNYGSGTRKHRMDLSLTFSNGRISGLGSDDVERFLIAGRYEAGGECHWTKTYVGSHDVFYRGFREGNGIWGTWELSFMCGGFHIWPRGEEEGAQESEAWEEPQSDEAISSPTILVRPGVDLKTYTLKLALCPEPLERAQEDALLKELRTTASESIE